MQELKGALKDAAKKLFNTDIEPEITRPDEQFGDYATNVALQLAKKAAATPRQIAQQLVDELQNLPGIKQVGIAGPGFINFTLTDEALQKAVVAATDLPKPNAGRSVVLEHTDPNPFKDFHIGHAYSNTVGAAIGKLLEATGAEVHQVSYHGDVGLHIAMAVWEFGEDFNWDPHKLESYDWPQGSSKVLGLYYKKGAEDYKNDTDKKKKIEELNQYIYEHLGDHDDRKMKFYYFGHERSFKYFDFIYESILKTPKFSGSDKVFENTYLESEMAKNGMDIVRKHIGSVFEESEGAIVYKGEKDGFHTRVFITKNNLPTYEAKEIGLAFAKEHDYPIAQVFIVVTANEIDEYFRVLLAAINKIKPELASKIQHRSHGVVKLPTGKMSSRTGDVVNIPSLDIDLGDALERLYGKDGSKSEIIFGAMKYTFLKHRLGEDIVYEPKETMSLEGNSGPYLQYAHARACSILAKANQGARGEGRGSNSPLDPSPYPLDPNERSLARKISEYPEVIAKSVNELMPHHVCTYLYELAQAFNSFYETSRIIGDERESIRLKLVKSYSQVLKSGLSILNIEAPERM